MPNSTATSQLEPLSEKGLQRLKREADDIGQEVTELYFQAHPECYRGDADRIRAMCKADFQYHLRFVLGAMVTSTLEVFSDYARWLREVLSSRNLAAEHAIDSFTLMREAIIKRLDKQDQPVASAVLDSGIAALKDNIAFRGFYTQEKDKVLVGSVDYTGALVGGSKKDAEKIARLMLDHGHLFIDLEVGVVQPAMYEIGRLWQENKITVAQEHLATAISQNVIAREFANADFAEPVDRKVVCACVEGNHHGLGLRMISDAYEILGWDSSFLGADTPNSAILAQVDSENPDVLALSVSLPQQILELKKLITQMRADMGGRMPSIVIGGLALNNYQELISRVKVDEFYLDAKSLWDDLK